jgi:hypothetical protein
VSQEDCARLRESVPCVKVYRYNPKLLYPNLNGYGDNGQRKVGLLAVPNTATCTADASRDAAHVLETGMQYSYVVGLYQNAQSAKLNQYFHTYIYIYIFLFNNVIYVFLLLCLRILIVCLYMATLTEVFPCFFFSCKANDTVSPVKTGHGLHSS